MGLVPLWRGPRAILYPLWGVALGVAGMLLAPHNALIAILWTIAALLPQEKRNWSVPAMTAIASGIVRWSLLESIPRPASFAAGLAIFIAIETVPRAALIAIAWTSRPAAQDAIDKFSSMLSTPMALIAIALGAAAALDAGIRPGIALILGCYVLIRAVRWLSYRVHGGINADTLGITQLFAELLALLLFACSACRW